MSRPFTGKAQLGEVEPLEVNGPPGPSCARPNFFIVGQPKTGTTALHGMLRQHPDIYMPDLKEPHFFCNDLFDTRSDKRDHIHPRTLEEYLSLFDGASPSQAAGEASTHYLRSHVAAANLHAFDPQARIVAVLREPASLLRSLHLEMVRLRYEPVRDLRAALALEPERKEGRELPPPSWWPYEFQRREMLQYSAHVRYVDQLSRFGEVFSPDQLLVLIYDDFRRDNRAVLRQVFRFLGVDDRFSVTPDDAYQSSSLRFETVVDAVHWLSTGSGSVARRARRAIKASAPQRLRRTLFDASRRLTLAPPPAVDQHLMAELRRIYAPEVVRLSEYLGRDLVSLWQAPASP